MRGGDESQTSDFSVLSAILFLLGIRVSVGVPVKSILSTFSGIGAEIPLWLTGLWFPPVSPLMLFVAVT